MALFFSGVVGFGAAIAPSSILAEQNTCAAGADAVLLIDMSSSMADGQTESRCEWSQIKDYNDTLTWFLNTKSGVTSDWCENDRSSYDSSVPHFSFVETSYAAAHPSKLEEAKTSGQNFVALLKVSDYSSIISFGESQVLVQDLASDHSASTAALSALTSAGMTNLGDAIDKATQTLNDGGRDTASKSIIIISDGRSNRPGSSTGLDSDNTAEDASYALQKAQEANQAGLRVFVLGFGNDANTGLLQSIADNASGTYYFEPTSDNLNSIYDVISQTSCPAPVCGNNTIESGEECDGTLGVGDHQQCSASCKIETLPYCGDGTINNGEECDGSANCEANCKLIPDDSDGDSDSDSDSDSDQDSNTEPETGSSTGAVGAPRPSDWAAGFGPGRAGQAPTIQPRVAGTSTIALSPDEIDGAIAAIRDQISKLAQDLKSALSTGTASETGTTTPQTPLSVQDLQAAIKNARIELAISKIKSEIEALKNGAGTATIEIGAAAIRQEPTPEIQQDASEGSETTLTSEPAIDQPGTPSESAPAGQPAAVNESRKPTLWESIANFLKSMFTF